MESHSGDGGCFSPFNSPHDPGALVERFWQVWRPKNGRSARWLQPGFGRAGLAGCLKRSCGVKAWPRHSMYGIHAGVLMVSHSLQISMRRWGDLKIKHPFMLVGSEITGSFFLNPALWVRTSGDILPARPSGALTRTTLGIWMKMSVRTCGLVQVENTRSEGLLHIGG